MPLPCQHRFVPYQETRQRPNIVVDGRANEGTVLTLSHWPRSGTPWPLKDDTSVEVAFRYLDSPEHHVDVEAVTNDHFDEDGLIGLHCLIAPDHAQRHRDLLIGAAHAGDFGTYSNRDAARLAFAIARLASGRHSPWGGDAMPEAKAERTGYKYARMLEELGALIDDIEGHAELWRDEDDFLSASERLFDSGAATIEEDEALDLAVVRVPAAWRRAGHGATVVHPMAIHNRTGCNRVATICGDFYRFGYRYESWVQMVTRRPPPRIDLRPLAEALTARDSRAWRFDGVSQITPKLRALGSRNGLASDAFLEALREALATGEPAWDPYDAEN